MEKEALSFTPSSNPIRDKISQEKRKALKSLSQDPSLTIREADKGGRIVVMDTCDYNSAINTILNNNDVYKLLNEDPTTHILDTINNHISILEDNDILSEKVSFNIRVGNAVCPHFYGLPKIHKDIPP